jgi:hypothetical protein
MVFRDGELMDAYFRGIQLVGDYNILDIDADTHGIKCTFEAWQEKERYQRHKKRFNTFEELEDYIKSLEENDDVVDLRNVTIQDSMQWELECEVLLK